MTRLYFQHLIQVYTAELDVVLSVSSKAIMFMDCGLQEFEKCCSHTDLTSQYLGSQLEKLTSWVQFNRWGEIESIFTKCIYLILAVTWDLNQRSHMSHQQLVSPRHQSSCVAGGLILVNLLIVISPPPRGYMICLFHY